MSKNKIVWKLEKRKIDDLKHYSKNPRIFTEKGMNDLEKSFKNIGMAQPVNINTDNIILSGNARIKKLKEMGITEVDVYVPDKKLTDKQCEEVVIRMNKNTAGDWDYEKLEDEFEKEDLEDWGFEEDELSFEDKNSEVIEDEVPEVKYETFIKKGDLILLGKHRVLCGDSTNKEDVDKLMNGKKIDMVFTDPPYGINLDPTNNFYARSRKAKGHNFPKIKGDDSIKTVVNILQLIQDIPVQILFGANYYCHYLPMTANWLVWDKREEEKERDFNSDCELAWVKCNKSSIRIFRHKWKGMIKASENGQERIHPTQKPIALAIWSFSEYASKSKLILDLFLGSGSTLIACEQTNRVCYGMEIDEYYCNVIAERYIRFKDGNTDNVRVIRDGIEYKWNDLKIQQ